ncbi:MAG: STING domain-containing protein [Bacteroidota bacterium]
MSTDWASDRRLDILVLGPMGEDPAGPTSTVPIRDALERLLQEDEIRALLDARSVQSATVHMPEGQNEPEIVQRVLHLLDTADLVVFNLNPKESTPDRANVFYELGLVHALGIPSMLVASAGTEVPFYVQSVRRYIASDFEVSTLADLLRQPLRDFLDTTNAATFANDRVSQFYRAPVINISAAAGLAVGYYFNFLARLITEGGFLAEYPDAYRHVVYVRPSSLETTYQADQERLRRALEAEGLTLETGRQLKAIPADNKGPIWYDHVEDIVIDIPRAIYTLRRSPRLLSFLARAPAERIQEAAFEQRLLQIGQDLLSDVEAALRYQVREDAMRVRREILHLSTIEEAPALVQRLLEG